MIAFRFITSGISTATILSIAIINTVILFTPVLALSQENNGLPANTDQRFQIEREGNGFLRLDKKTGETSFCRQVIDDIVCNLAIEERDTLHDEIGDLQNKLATLQEKFDALNEAPVIKRPKDDVPDPSSEEGAGAARDEIEREVDRAVEIAKQTMRKLFEVVKELQKEFGNESLN